MDKVPSPLSVSVGKAVETGPHAGLVGVSLGTISLVSDLVNVGKRKAPLSPTLLCLGVSPRETQIWAIRHECRCSYQQVCFHSPGEGEVNWSLFIQ